MTAVGVAWDLPSIPLRDVSWHVEASCVEYRVFWDVEDWKAAKTICRGCPFRDRCLEDAMSMEAGNTAFRWGVWGGLDAAERFKLASKRIRRVAA